MRIEDDEDVPSLEGSSSDNSYVEAPMENAQVGGSDPPVYQKIYNHLFRLFQFLLQRREPWFQLRILRDTLL